MRYKIYKLSDSSGKLWFVSDGVQLIKFNKEMWFNSLGTLVECAYGGVLNKSKYSNYIDLNKCIKIHEFNNPSELKELFPEYFI